MRANDRGRRTRSDNPGGSLLDQLHVVLCSADPIDETCAFIARIHPMLPLECQAEHADELVRLVGTSLAAVYAVMPLPALTHLPGCVCPACQRLLTESSLRPRPLTRHARQGALAVMTSTVREHAIALGRTADDPLIDRVARELREHAAMVAWGRELLWRLSGYSVGLAALALWRLFAWLPSGSPRPDFALTADDILEAERRLADALARSSVRSDTIAELLREVHGDPDADAPRAVLADALLATGDPRGELIALQLAQASSARRDSGARADQASLSDGQADAADRQDARADAAVLSDRIDELLRVHWSSLLGPFAAICTHARFTRGFVSELALGGAPWSAIQRAADEPALATVEILTGARGTEPAYVRFVTSPHARALRAIDVWDATTVAALESTTAPIAHVGLASADHAPLWPSLCERAFAACERFASLDSLAMSVVLFGQLAATTLLARVTALALDGDFATMLAVWPDLPPRVALTICPSRRSAPTTLRLAYEADGLVATITGHAMTQRLARAFDQLPAPLARLVVVGATPFDAQLAAVAAEHGSAFEVKAARRATGYKPA